MNDQKKKALASAVGQIERQFGKNACIRIGDVQRWPNTQT